MINCEYCENKSRSESGMAMHVRKAHPDKWNKTLKESFSEGFNLGTREPGSYYRGGKYQSRKSKVRAAVGKGEKKPPINQRCPWCTYKSIHPPGLAHHIKAVHPKKWKGRLSITLGREPKPWEKYPSSGTQSRTKRQEKWRKGKTGLPTNRSQKWLATRTKNLLTEQKKPAGQIRIPNNFCMECGADQRPAQLAKGFMNNDETNQTTIA